MPELAGPPTVWEGTPVRVVYEDGMAWPEALVNGVWTRGVVNIADASFKGRAATPAELATFPD